MKKLIIVSIIASFFLINSVCADISVKETAKKVVFTDWVKEGALKWGYVGSLVTYQALNGLIEGYHFRQEKTHIINNENYHVYATMQRLAGITTGWMIYANMRSSDKSRFGKFRRFLGGAMISRNAYEWLYKTARYGTPFDYTPEHNMHSMVYFGFKGGKLIDLYIGTGKVTGPLVDMAFILLGLLILE